MFNFFSEGGGWGSRTHNPSPIGAKFRMQDWTYGVLLPASFHLDRCTTSGLRDHMHHIWPIFTRATPCLCGICCHRLSVCLSVRLFVCRKSEFYQSG